MVEKVWNLYDRQMVFNSTLNLAKSKPESNSMNQVSPRDQSLNRRLEAVTPKPHGRSRLSELPDDDAFYTPCENICANTPSGQSERFFTPSEMTGGTKTKLNHQYVAENDLQVSKSGGRGPRDSPMECTPIEVRWSWSPHVSNFPPDILKCLLCSMQCPLSGMNNSAKAMDLGTPLGHRQEDNTCGSFQLEMAGVNSRVLQQSDTHMYDDDGLPPGSPLSAVKEMQVN